MYNLTISIEHWQADRVSTCVLSSGPAQSLVLRIKAQSCA